MRNATLVTLTLLVATSASAGGMFGDCDYKAPRSLTAQLTGASRIVVIGRAGTLKITGVGGASQVRASGTACTSERDLLNQIVLSATRYGNTLRIEAVIPEDSNSSWFDFARQATLDFEVSVPDNLPLEVSDGSGEMTIENVAAARVTDGSGSLHIRGVNGNLEVNDGSGELTIENVTGEVRVTDGSGSISIDHAGSVNILADGSGSVDIMHVQRDVNIGSKGSGSVDVDDVGGNFTVAHKGSGHIEYASVRGQVRVPERNRD
jgi:hypothetical protein